LKNNKLDSLSEQQLVDCSKANDGCNGGLMDRAFEFAETNALDTEAQYPYMAKGGKCRSITGEVKVTSFVDVTAKDPEALALAVSKGPVSIAVDANKWSMYSSGIFSNCGTSLDHGVLLVGYGSENGKDYWLVKNSWGSSWGENGYIRLARDMDSNDAGTCGIQNAASYPVM